MISKGRLTSFNSPSIAQIWLFMKLALEVLSRRETQRELAVF